MNDAATTTSYAPSGKCTPKGIAVIVGLGLGAMIVACVGLHCISRLVYLGLVFPAVIGLAVGVSTLVGVRIAKCRMPLAAGAIGVVLGLSDYGALHYLNYRADVRSFRRNVQGKLGQKAEDAQAVRAELNAALVRAWGRPGFLGYLGAWWKGIWRVLWVLELAIVVGLAAWIPWCRACTPFCEACEQWCDHAQVLVASPEAEQKIVEVCRPERLGQLQEIERVSEHENRCVVELDYCEACRKTGYLTVTCVEEGGDGAARERQVLCEVVVSGDQVAAVIPDGSEPAPRQSSPQLAEDELPEPSADPGEVLPDDLAPASEEDREPGEGEEASKVPPASEDVQEDNSDDGKV